MNWIREEAGKNWETYADFGHTPVSLSVLLFRSGAPSFPADNECDSLTFCRHLMRLGWQAVPHPIAGADLKPFLGGLFFQEGVLHVVVKVSTDKCEFFDQRKNRIIPTSAGFFLVHR